MIEAQNRNFLTYILLVLLARFQLGNQSAPARLGNFTARARSSRKIPARTHHYKIYKFFNYRNIFSIEKDQSAQNEDNESSTTNSRKSSLNSIQDNLNDLKTPMTISMEDLDDEKGKYIIELINEL